MDSKVYGTHRLPGVCGVESEDGNLCNVRHTFQKLFGSCRTRVTIMTANLSHAPVWLSCAWTVSCFTCMCSSKYKHFVEILYERLCVCAKVQLCADVSFGVVPYKQEA